METNSAVKRIPKGSGNNRPKGLLQYPDTSVLPEIFKVCCASHLRGPSSPIRMSPVQNLLRSPHFHKGYDRSSLPAKTPIHHSHPILSIPCNQHTRYASGCKIGPPTKYPSPICHPTSSISRMDFELGEVKLR